MKGTARPSRHGEPARYGLGDAGALRATGDNPGTLIDSIAVAYALEPKILTTTALRVGIETRGEMTLGQTVVDRRKHFQWTHLPMVNVASAIDAARFLELLVEAIS